MAFCRVENSFVVEVITVNPDGLYHPDLIWVACPDGTQQGWIQDGATFREATANDRMTLAEAVANKYAEADAYAQGLIDDAYANPVQGVTVDNVLHERIVNSRRKDKADKLAGEIALDQAEKDEAKTDQKLSEYERKCQEANDKARTNIDKGNDADEVMAMDIPTITTWPEWSPPV